MKPPSLLQILTRLEAEGLLPPEDASALLESPAAGAESPWFVRVLVGFGAWNAALLFLVALGLAGALDSRAALGMFGIMALAGSLLLLRVSTSAFLHQLGLALHLAGLFLLIAAASIESRDVVVPCLATMALAAVCVPLFPHPVLRFVDTVTFCVAAMVLAADRELPYATEILPVLLAAGAGALWLVPWRVPREPIAFGLLASLFASLVHVTSRRFESLPWMTTAGLALLALVLLAAILRSLGRRPQEPVGVVTAGGLVALSIANVASPCVTAAFGFMLLGFFVRNRLLYGVAILGFGAALYEHYFNLETTLLVKSGLMLLGAALILGVRYALLRATRGAA